jgi:hypothetical protein
MKATNKNSKHICKKLLCTATLLLCITVSNAQTTKKKTNPIPHTKSVVKTKPIIRNSNSSFDKTKLQVGGNIQGDFSSQGGSGSSNFGISGFAGYKITNDILLGIKAGTTFKTNVSNFEIGLFGRYYYDSFFAGAGINYAMSSYKYDLGPFGTQKVTANLTYGTIEGGYRIPISEKITMETSLNINIPISPTGGDIWYGAKVGAVYQF